MADVLLYPNTFIAPTSGIYHFDATLLWKGFTGNSANDFAGLTIWVNNIAYVGDRRATTAVSFSNHISADISLFQGETVHLTVYHSNSTPQKILNITAGNRFSGRFVSTL